MPPAFVVRFSPTGPWRIGPDSGERDRVETMLHSDALYSAVSASMAQLGLLGEWLEAAFRNPDGPAVRFSSCYPFQDELAFVVPPSSLWPPPASLKVRWKGARFAPLKVVEDLLAERPLDEERWRVDGLSQCLVPADWSRGPFQPAIRSNAAVDRLSGNAVAHRTACLEFSPGAGMWAMAAFAGEEAKARWMEPVEAALRLLADSGLGGERARGWGRFQQPEFREGTLPDLVLGPGPADDSDGGTGPGPATTSEAATPEAGRGPTAAQGAAPPPATEAAYWLLSLFSPAEKDRVDWGRGHYSLLARGGRVESPSAHGGLKKVSRMIAEGSVIFSGTPPDGEAVDVAPDGVSHPVYRAGFALAVPIPYKEASR